MKKFLSTLALIGMLLPVAAMGQSSQRQYTAMQVGGKDFAVVVPNAYVYVCQYNTQLACTTPVAIYADTGLTQRITQPLRANAAGVYSYYIPNGSQVVEKVCTIYGQCSFGGVQIGPTGTATSTIFEIGGTALQNQTTINFQAGSNITITNPSAGNVLISATGGGGGGSVSSVSTPSGSWPTWLVPTTTNPTSTPSISVAASPIPNSALQNPSLTLGSTVLTLGATSSSVTGLTIDGVSPSTMAFVDPTSSIQTQINSLLSNTVTSINGTSGVFTFNFSAGAGSCSGTSCTFTGSGSGGGSVTNFIALTGNWPSWLIPSVTNSTTTPSLSVAIGGSIAQYAVFAAPQGGAGAPSFQTTLAGLTLDGVSPTTMGYLDATSSIQTQLNSKASSSATFTLGSTTVTLGGTTTSVTGLTVDGVSPTTFGYVDPTSSIQTQLNSKQPNLGYTPAHSGANSDITSLTGLSTPLAASEGGTGATSLGGTLSVMAGVLNCNAATTSVLGCVKPDGTTITISGGVISSVGGGGGITQLTGDGTAGPGSGSQPFTLATVNSGPGSCGDATHVCQITTNGKGLVTAQSAVAITSIANIQVTTGTSTINANSCTADLGPVTVTGLATTSTINFTGSTDTSGSTGWGSTGGLQINPWPAANALHYKICNPTSSNITPSSVIWNVSFK